MPKVVRNKRDDSVVLVIGRDGPWPGTLALLAVARPDRDLSLPEIRRLLWQLVLRVPRGVRQVLAWSHWHQWMSLCCHYRRQHLKLQQVLTEQVGPVVILVRVKDQFRVTYTPDTSYTLLQQMETRLKIPSPTMRVRPEVGTGLCAGTA